MMTCECTPVELVQQVRALEMSLYIYIFFINFLISHHPAVCIIHGVCYSQLVYYSQRIHSKTSYSERTAVFTPSLPHFTPTLTPPLPHFTPPQADAIVLEGGYVLFMVFRGDNTAPKFAKDWSPLHNRCLQLLAKLEDDGTQLFWDNLYPSVDVVQGIANGGDFQAEVPAGPDHGKRVEITIPKVLSDGTTRTNRGVPKACVQPSKQGMSAKALEAIKSKPPLERLKVRVTESEPNVMCISFFDNGPVHMLSTIHTDAKFVTIHRRRFDGKEMKVVKLPIERLEVRSSAACAMPSLTVHELGTCTQAIHDYNSHMNNVDIFDQLAHYYNLDGMGWRDRKWWVPIFKALLKGACDQAYALYKRTFEIEQEAAAAAPAAATAGAPAAAPAADDSPARNTRTATRKRTPQPMSHFDFLEKIAEGLFIEGYNSTKRDAKARLDLLSYTLADLEAAIAEVHGDAAVRAKPIGKRKGRRVFEDDDLLPESDTREHRRIAAVPKDRPKVFCSFRCCPWAAQNKRGKCGEKSKRTQAARSSCKANGVWCMDCNKAYHVECYALFHRFATSMDELTPLPHAKRPKKRAGQAGGSDEGVPRAGCPGHGGGWEHRLAARRRGG